MSFFVSGMKSKQSVSYQLDTATETLAKFYKLYEQDFLNVRMSNNRGKKLSVEEVVRLAALQRVREGAKTRSAHPS